MVVVYVIRCKCVCEQCSECLCIEFQWRVPLSLASRKNSLCVCMCFRFRQYNDKEEDGDCQFGYHLLICWCERENKRAVRLCTLYKDKDAGLWFDLEYSDLFQIQMHLREKMWCDIVANCWWIWWTVMRFWNVYSFSTHLNSFLCKWMNLFMNFMSEYCENRGKKEQIECFVWKLIKMSSLFGKEKLLEGRREIFGGWNAAI